MASAKAAGVVRYFTGKPCKRGHVAERFVSSRACADCLSARVKADHMADPERSRERVRKRRRSPEYAAYMARTQSDRAAKASAWTAANRDKSREYKRRFNRANAHLWKDYYLTHTKRCRAATPSWLSTEQRMAMVEVYKEAKARPGGPWHVDHIVPLRGENVCGLHVPWNLQILSETENRAKGNRMTTSKPPVLAS